MKESQSKSLAELAHALVTPERYGKVAVAAVQTPENIVPGDE